MISGSGSRSSPYRPCIMLENQTSESLLSEPAMMWPKNGDSRVLNQKRELRHIVKFQIGKAIQLLTVTHTSRRQSSRSRPTSATTSAGSPASSRCPSTSLSTAGPAHALPPHCSPSPSSSPLSGRRPAPAAWSATPSSGCRRISAPGWAKRSANSATPGSHFSSA